MFQPSPRFYDNQIISAEGHLNALADNVRVLFALYNARKAPFPYLINIGRTLPGHEGRTEDGWRRKWTGAIRHKVNRLRYRIEYNADNVTGLKVRIVWHTNHTVVINVTGGNGTVDNFIDVSSLSDNTFYFVNIDIRAYHDQYGDNVGQGWIKVLEVYEEWSPDLPVLASFATGTTPTAAQWQSLSERADLLYSLLNPPKAAFQGGYAATAFSTPVWAGQFYHLSNFWYYDVRLRPSFNGSVAKLVLRVNGVAYELGQRKTPDDRYPAPHSSDEGDTEFDFWTHRGVVNISSQNLTEGQRYHISLDLEVSGNTQESWDAIATAKLFALWQHASLSPSLAWWQPMPVWGRGSAVTGSGSVKSIRDNLQNLSARVTYRNYPTLQRIPNMPPQWTFRQHRYLHYYCIPDEHVTPKLGYWNGSQWQEISLSKENNRWLVYDLDSCARLFVGVYYRLDGVMFALEDITD